MCSFLGKDTHIRPFLLHTFVRHVREWEIDFDKILRTWQAKDFVVKSSESEAYMNTRKDFSRLASPAFAVTPTSLEEFLRLKVHVFVTVNLDSASRHR